MYCAHSIMPRVFTPSQHTRISEMDGPLAKQEKRTLRRYLKNRCKLQRDKQRAK